MPEQVCFDPHVQVGRHFQLWEMTASQTAARLGISNQPSPEQFRNLQWLCCHILDPIRDKFGPVRITSGLRVPELNDAIPGSSKTSMHRYGLAADFAPYAFFRGEVTLREVVAWIVTSPLEFDQVIYEYGRWIHLGAAHSPPGQFRREALMKFEGSRYLPFNSTDPRVAR